jgi:hypothetical protein
MLGGFLLFGFRLGLLGGLFAVPSLHDRCEVFNQCFAVGGEDGFWVELQAVDGVLGVLHGHDFAVFGFGSGFEGVGFCVLWRRDDEGVVAADLHGAG